MWRTRRCTRIACGPTKAPLFWHTSSADMNALARFSLTLPVVQVGGERWVAHLLLRAMSGHPESNQGPIFALRPSLSSNAGERGASPLSLLAPLSPLRQAWEPCGSAGSLRRNLRAFRHACALRGSRARFVRLSASRRLEAPARFAPVLSGHTARFARQSSQICPGVLLRVVWKPPRVSRRSGLGMRRSASRRLEALTRFVPVWSEQITQWKTNIRWGWGNPVIDRVERKRGWDLGRQPLNPLTP